MRLILVLQPDAALKSRLRAGLFSLSESIIYVINRIAPSNRWRDQQSDLGILSHPGQVGSHGAGVPSYRRWLSGLCHRPPEQGRDC